MVDLSDPYGAGTAPPDTTDRPAPKQPAATPSDDDPYGGVAAFPRAPDPPPAQPPQQPEQPTSFLDRAWQSLVGRVTQASAPPAALAQPSVPFQEPHSTAGIRRGVEDVWDTGHRVVTDVTGGDMDALRQAQQARVDQYNQEHGDSTAAALGRIAGQTIATAPLLGGAGRVIGGAIQGLGPILPTGIADTVGALTGATPAASTLGRVGQLAVQGAATGAGQAALTGDNPVTGAAVGGAVGPIVGGLTKVADAARGLVGGVDPAMAQLGQTALGLGVKPPLAAMSESPTMRIIGAQARELPLSGATGQTRDVQRTVQGQLLNLMGKPGSTQITPTAIDDVLDTSGKQIGAIANRTPITADCTLVSDVGAIKGDYGKFGLSDSQRASVEGPLNDMLQNFSDGNGTIAGQTYQNLTARDGPLDTLMNNQDSTVARFGSRIRTALDEAFQRSAAPGDQAALTQARQQYRLGRTLEPLAAKSTTGDIPMQSTLGRLANEYGATGGTGDYQMTGLLGDIGRVGAQFGRPAPESGTGPRSMVLNALQHPLGLLLGAGPLLGPNWALQKALGSQSTVQNLINTSLNPSLIPSTSRAIVPGVAAATSTADNLRGLGGAGY